MYVYSLINLTFHYIKITTITLKLFSALIEKPFYFLLFANSCMYLVPFVLFFIFFLLEKNDDDDDDNDSSLTKKKLIEIVCDINS